MDVTPFPCLYSHKICCKIDQKIIKRHVQYTGWSGYSSVGRALSFGLQGQLCGKDWELMAGVAL